MGKMMFLMVLIDNDGDDNLNANVSKRFCGNLSLQTDK